MFMDIQGVIWVSKDIQDYIYTIYYIYSIHMTTSHGHLGDYLGCQGEGAKGPTNGLKGHSLLQELGISARSALYF